MISLIKICQQPGSMSNDLACTRIDNWHQ